MGKRLPGWSSEIRGARKVGRRDRIPKGWCVVKEARYYTHIKPCQGVK